MSKLGQGFKKYSLVLAGFPKENVHTKRRLGEAIAGETEAAIASGVKYIKQDPIPNDPFRPLKLKLVTPIR